LTIGQRYYGASQRPPKAPIASSFGAIKGRFKRLEFAELHGTLVACHRQRAAEHTQGDLAWQVDKTPRLKGQCTRRSQFNSNIAHGAIHGCLDCSVRSFDSVRE
jgi:hypothetical protein